MVPQPSGRTALRLLTLRLARNPLLACQFSASLQQSAPALAALVHPIVSSQISSSLRLASTSTKKTTEKKAGTKKKKPAPKKKKAAPKKKQKAAKKKAAPKKKKRAVSPKVKEMQMRRDLRAAALINGEPAKLPETPYTLFVSAHAKGKKVGNGEGFSSLGKEIGDAFKKLGESEMASLKDKAIQNKAENLKRYNDWVVSHPVSTIISANTARAGLSRRLKSIKLKPIADARIPSKPRSPYALYVKSRWASGDFNDVSQSAPSLMSMLAKEWKSMPDSHPTKKEFIDLSEQESTKYAAAMEAITK